MSALAQLASDEAKLDPRLEALAEGRLGAAELAGLEAEAAQDPALARAIEAFRPLDAAAAERVVVAAQRAFGATGDGAPEAPDGATTEAPPDNVVPFPLRRVVAGAMMTAAAVAALFFLAPRGLDRGPLPPYAFELVGGDQAFRGAEPEPAKTEVRSFSPTSRVELRVRPEVPIEGPAGAAVYFEANGVLIPIPMKIESSEQGAFRIVGSALDLFGDRTGEVRVFFAVARRSDLPSAERIRAIAEGEADDRVQVFSERLRLLAGAE